MGLISMIGKFWEASARSTRYFHTRWIHFLHDEVYYGELTA